MILRSNYYFENVLFVITAFTSGLALLSDNFYMLLLLWLLPLGGLQLLHMLIMGVNHYNTPVLSKWLMGYWITVVVYFIVGGLYISMRLKLPDDLMLPILPVIISILPWYISSRFKQPRNYQPGVLELSDEPHSNLQWRND